VIKKIIIASCTTLIIFAGLFPPWVFRFRGVNIRHLGYSFIFTPPAGGEIDIRRLFIQWVMIALFFGVIYWFAKNKRQE